MNTSPGLISLGGNDSRKWPTVAGRQPMKPGRLMVDWASERPLASVSTMAKSLPSRTRVEKQVRTKAAEASSTTLMSRFHRISSSIGSNPAALASVAAVLRITSVSCWGMLLEFLDGDRDGQVGQDRHIRLHTDN